MNDFFEEIKVSSVPVVALQKDLHLPSENFHLFSTESVGIQYLPNRLTDMDDNPFLLRPYMSSKTVGGMKLSSGTAREREIIRDHYVTLGKMLNYLMREQFPIPKSLASPFIVLYLIRPDELDIDDDITSDTSMEEDDDDNDQSEDETYSTSRFDFFCSNMEQLSDSELIAAVKDFDQGYKGSIDEFYVASSNKSARENLFKKFINPVILRPREEAMVAIKEGFDEVHLCSHLQYFTYKEFVDSFAAEEVYDYEDLKPIISYDFSEVSMSASEQFAFTSAVDSALSSLGHEMLRWLLEFTTGTSLFRHGDVDGTRITLRPRIYPYNPSQDSRASSMSKHNIVRSSKACNDYDPNKGLSQYPYPKWPLPRASACFFQMYIPFFKACKESNVKFGNEDESIPSCRLWTKENVLENIVRGLHHCRGDFHDS